MLFIKKDESAKRHAGEYTMPGGGIEAGEGPAAALAHELMEELGVSAQGCRLVGEFDLPGQKTWLYIMWVDEFFDAWMDLGEGEHARFMTGAEIAQEPAFEDGMRRRMLTLLSNIESGHHE